MPEIPDLTDPRYLDEVGWFLYHEKYRRDRFGGSYDDERLANSRLLRDEVAAYLDQSVRWFEDKTVVTIGCGCTGDLSAFPASVKVAIDPLLYAYQHLDMLVPDEVGGRTIYLSQGAENLPLLDRFADLVLCRNALDHMPDPRVGLDEICRILADDGVLFVSVDTGGDPTPDEPTVFSAESLEALVRARFEIVRLSDRNPPHSAGRTGNVRALARKIPDAGRTLDKEQVLKAYEARLP
jgi:SAM-dependent methyltransferase